MKIFGCKSLNWINNLMSCCRVKDFQLLVANFAVNINNINITFSKLFSEHIFKIRLVNFLLTSTFHMGDILFLPRETIHFIRKYLFFKLSI